MFSISSYTLAGEFGDNITKIGFLLGPKHFTSVNKYEEKCSISETTFNIATIIWGTYFSYSTNFEHSRENGYGNKGVSNNYRYSSIDFGYIFPIYNSKKKMEKYQINSNSPSELTLSVGPIIGAQYADLLYNDKYYNLLKK